MLRVVQQSDRIQRSPEHKHLGAHLYGFSEGRTLSVPVLKRMIFDD